MLYLTSKSVDTIFGLSCDAVHWGVIEFSLNAVLTVLRALKTPEDIRPIVNFSVVLVAKVQ